MRLLRQLSSLRLPFKSGDSVKLTRVITQLDLDNFSNISGDHNPIHKSRNKKPLVHGAFLNSIVAGLIGTQLPGPGTIVISQNFRFPNKCYVNEEVEIFIQLVEVRKILKVKYECKQEDRLVFDGEAQLMISK